MPFDKDKANKIIESGGFNSDDKKKKKKKGWMESLTEAVMDNIENRRKKLQGK